MKRRSIFLEPWHAKLYSRRDFVIEEYWGLGRRVTWGIGSLASTSVSAAGPFGPSGSAWTGYGGIGDYQWSNGNTEKVRTPAHAIRDHLYPELDPVHSVETTTS